MYTCNYVYKVEFVTEHEETRHTVAILIHIIPQILPLSKLYSTSSIKQFLLMLVKLRMFRQQESVATCKQLSNFMYT